MNTPETDHRESSLLASRLESSFAVTRERWQFGDYRLNICRPADPEMVLDDVTLLQTYDQMKWQPYWAQAWEASLGLCEYLTRLDLANRMVMDLGCGLGITTALLLAAGARVVAGDNAPPALDFARLNCEPWNERCEIRMIDWHRTDLNRRFELIVGSDILYDRGEIVPLDRFFRRHLTSHGQVIVADPSRPMTVELLDRFTELGWNQQTILVHSTSTRLPTRIVVMTQH